MARGARGDPEGKVPGPRPGALSALLQDLARAPEVGGGTAWEAVLRPGGRVGKLELVRELGRGGFGVVWEARDLELGRSVALKAVRAGSRAGLKEERLLREAEAAARLQHPNLVTLFDVGRAEAGPYLVLELLRGKTLAERLAEGPVSPAEAVRIATEVAKGLAHAHGQGVVHRDLKPENVFVCEDGQVKALDFGLAHAFGARRLEGGSAGYMAPEQLAGAPEDERTDVFALGVMLHEMLSGERPFRDDAALRSKAAAPALEVPGEPGLGELVHRMLAKDPTARPRDGAAVREALAALAPSAPARPASAPVRVRARSRFRIPALVAAGALLGIAFATGWQWWSSHRSPPPATSSPEALERYVEGLKLVESSRNPEAIVAFKRATAIDRDFALAHLWIALVGPGAGAGRASAEQKEAVAEALRNQVRLPPRERALARALEARFAQRPEAEGLYARAAESWPGDKLVLLAVALRGGRCGDVPMLERAAAADPAWQPAVSILLECLYDQGRQEEAFVRARAWVEKAPSAQAYRSLAETAVAIARNDVGIDAGRRALAIDESFASRIALAVPLSAADRNEEAERIVRPLVAPDRPWLDRWVGGVWLSATLADQGRFREARRAAESIPPDEEREGATTINRTWALLNLLWCGDDHDEMLRILKEIEDASPVQRQFVPAGRLLHGDPEGAAAFAPRIGPGLGLAQYEALLAARSGDAERAFRILLDAASSVRHAHRRGAHWTRARIARDLGRDAELLDAAAATLALSPNGPFRALSDATSLVWSAEAFERRGERARAIEALDRLLARWKRGDTDQPLLVRAKAMRARLARPGGR